MSIQSNSTVTEIAFCDKCNEVTPQVHSTTGGCCQICLHTNPYKLERAFAAADDKWLSAFWQNKYYQLKNCNGFAPGATVFTVKVG